MPTSDNPAVLAKWQVRKLAPGTVAQAAAPKNTNRPNYLAHRWHLDHRLFVRGLMCWHQRPLGPAGENPNYANGHRPPCKLLPCLGRPYRTYTAQQHLMSLPWRRWHQTHYHLLAACSRPQATPVDVPRQPCRRHHGRWGDRAHKQE